jgi:hypothetical protein
MTTTETSMPTLLIILVNTETSMPALREKYRAEVLPVLLVLPPQTNFISAKNANNKISY